MIHTMTLVKQCTREEFDAFSKYEPKEMYNPKQNVIVDVCSDKKTYDTYPAIETLSPYGIKHIHIREIASDAYNGCYLSVFVNCSQLLQFDNKIQLVTEQNLPLIQEMFDGFLQSELPFLPLFKDWNTQRVDFAVNCYTENVDQYLKLLQHGDRIKTLSADEDKRRKNHLRAMQPQKDGSFYHVSNAYTLNFYSKEDERRNQGCPPEEIEQAKNILRIEVQCNTTKLYQLSQQFNLDGRKPAEFFNFDIAEKVLFFGLNKIVKDADFHRRKKVLQFIQEKKKLPVKSKALLLDMVDLINTSNRNVYKAREILEKTQNIDADLFRNKLNYLRKHNINAITIPDKHKLVGIDYDSGLPSLHKLLGIALAEEKSRPYPEDYTECVAQMKDAAGVESARNDMADFEAYQKQIKENAIEQHTQWYNEHFKTPA